MEILDQLFHLVRVPSAVFRECIVPDKPQAVSLQRYLEGKVTEVDVSQFVIAASGLGSGELAAMALYKHLQADRLLLDDRRARKVAQMNSIAVIGSVGVLLFAKKQRLLPQIKPRLVSIREAGIHLGEQLLAEALRLAEES